MIRSVLRPSRVSSHNVQRFWRRLADGLFGKRICSLMISSSGPPAVPGYHQVRDDDETLKIPIRAGDQRQDWLVGGIDHIHLFGPDTAGGPHTVVKRLATCL